MSTLAEIQNGFLRAVLHGDGTAIERAVAGGRFDPAERIAVYRNNVLASAARALGDLYPAVLDLVGDDYFRQAAHAYVRAHPSRSGNLHDFGECFPDFVITLPGMAALPYARDVARLEWAWHRAFHAAADAPFSFERLAAMAPESHGRLRPRLARSATLLTSPWPVVAIWRACLASAESAPAVDFADGAGAVLVLRVAGEVRVRRLSPGEQALLSTCAEGASLEAAIEDAERAEPGFDLPAFLGTCVDAGIIVDFTH